MYSLVIGIIAAIALAFLVLAMKMSDLTQGVYTRDAAEFQAAVAERIRPAGQVYMPGEEREAAAPTVEYDGYDPDEFDSYSGLCIDNH